MLLSDGKGEKQQHRRGERGQAALTAGAGGNWARVRAKEVGDKDLLSRGNRGEEQACAGRQDAVRMALRKI